MNDLEIKKWQLYIHQRVKVDPDSGCWNWTLSLNSRGYGWSTGHSGHSGHLVHRMSYEVFIGPIPKDLLIRHQCHNKKCCNPAHLLVGTHQDNTNDSIRDGLPMGGRIKGTVVLQSNGMARLTEENVLEMKRLDVTREHTRAKIADMFGISASQASQILNGKSWKHLH